MRPILILAGLTFREAWRRWVVLIGLLLSVIFLLMYGFGFAYIKQQMDTPPTLSALLRPQAYNFLLLAGLYVVHGLVVMLSIFASVDAIAGEIGSHTIQTMVTKPVFRWQIVAGKWLGYAAMILLYVIALSGGVILVTNAEVGYLPPNAGLAVGLLCLEALVLLSLSLLGGTRLATLPNGVALFMLYGVTFIGTWVSQIGSLLNADTAVRLGNAVSMVLPVEVLWRLAASLLQPKGGLSAQFLSPFSALLAPDPTVALYAAAYGLVALLLAMWSFTRRDL